MKLGPEPVSMSTSEKIQVLVVDDIPLMRTMLVKFVQTLGRKGSGELKCLANVDIVEAPNGKAALGVLEDVRVDLIFLDLMMPEMDGLSFLRELRRSPKLQDIPVIVCSAVGEPGTITKARALGACGYITKPFTLKSVEANLQEALAQIR